ncbi:ATP-binding cassette domain-containing protein [Candidatus Mycoplasma mahonii]|uniref:ATP-binding cassette domain-containing protein n=1 Tax=Candidatus Mycoplasma mahonii TaxID=3004105 RepID=UPI0026F2BF06|nr:ABC transporter ATP-binding protein [Candidatus Mycoplasma mahonii]WKX02767.1 ABC transporter ATP-binding protein [Candidatus Mycoplasma mahonii]
MIKSITIKSNDQFDNTKKTIEFGRTNIIIGPKGGGKSTLYDILANLNNGKVFSTSIDALEKHHLEIESYNIDGELFPFNNVGEVKISKRSNAKDEHYLDRNDVIYQDDPIKKNLSESSDLRKKKQDFAKSLVNESKDVNDLIMKIKTFTWIVGNIALKNNFNINWSNSLTILDTSKSEDQILFNLNYSRDEINRILKNDKSYLKEETSYIESLISDYKNKIMNLENSSKQIISKKYTQDAIKSYKSLIETNESLIKISNQEHKRIMRIDATIENFSDAYRKVVLNLRKDLDSASRMASYESQTENHFKEMGTLLRDSRTAFNNIIRKEIWLDLNRIIETENMLELAITEKYELDQQIKFELLKKVLYSSHNVQTLIGNWIKAQLSKTKEFKNELIINHLAGKVKEMVKVLANGKDYDTLSLGQRSIYGIKYKFNHSVGKPIFLDQPEDNLDNYTIANELVKLVESKKEQVFIVTHNANIGLLPKPDKIIVADFQEDQELQTIEQYKVGTLIEKPELESDGAHFLEGGKDKITTRLEIIEGERQ